MKEAFLFGLVLALTVAGGAATPGESADYPARTITVINPMAVGGSRDVVARTFATVGEKYLGQPIVVINKPGASGMIGGRAGAQAAPDGYTLTVVSTGDICALEWEAASGRKPLYTLSDFTTLGAFTVSPALVVVPPGSPWKTLADLVKDCQAKSNHYAFASGGKYGIVHISLEILMRAAGFKARQVPYPGGGPALNAVVGGHVDFSAQYPSTSIPLARGKKLKILAVMDNKRLNSIPDVPTTVEQGVQAEIDQMVGLVVPKNTPMPVVEKLRGVVAKVVKDKVFVDALTALGEDIDYLNGEELVKYFEIKSAIIRNVIVEIAKEDLPK
jgi:tripartite-type tricarboxylate transporter receptor subunit TctC